MKKYYNYLFISIALVVFLMSSCKDNQNPTEPSQNSQSANSFDTIITNVSKDITINLKKINITIPQGTIPSGTKLSVKELELSTLPLDNNFDFNTAFDISLSSSTSFEKELTISINYDTQKLPAGKLKNQLGASYYNESSKRWIAFQNVSVDTIKHFVTIKTNHLTKISTWSLKRAMGYTDYMESANFIIYWDQNSIPSNSLYNSPNKNSYS